MDDEPLLVHVEERVEDLGGVQPGFRLGESSPSSQQFHERSVRVEFEQDVYTVVFLEAYLKFDDVDVVSAVVNENLALQFLARSAAKNRIFV